MRVRLNSFQRAMLQWDSLHPYNAVHAVRLAGAPEGDRLAGIVRGVLERQGVAGVTLDRSGRSCVLDGGRAALDLVELPRAAEPMAALRLEVERQLNTPFPREGRWTPFRAFLVPDAGSFFFGLVYFHAIADAEPVVGLMRCIAGAYAGGASAGSLESAGAAADEPGPPRGTAGLLARALADFPRRFEAMRACCRPRARDPLDQANRLLWLVLDGAEALRVARAAKDLGVTLNDVLLALMLKAFAPMAPQRLSATRRRRIAVGCIVNTRKRRRAGGPAAFGLSLGSFVVAHEVPDGMGVADLARAAARETARIKRGRLYLASRVELAVVRLLWTRLSPEQRCTFYLKHHPLWGGITNLTLDRLWDPSGAVDLGEYFRAVSTGPATPLVLSVTKVGARLNLGLTYRSGVFGAGQIEDFRRVFFEEVRALGADR